MLQLLSKFSLKVMAVTFSYLSSLSKWRKPVFVTYLMSGSIRQLMVHPPALCTLDLLYSWQHP